MAARKQDPAKANNEAVLAEREERIEAARKPIPDLGLGLEDKKPKTANEYFRDEFDRKAFGDEKATITKVIYGPDPLVDECPEFRLKLEQHGIQDFAALMEEAVLQKGTSAMPNKLMQRALQNAINQFGREQVARAFRDRVLAIPSTTVEIDASDEYDPEIMGGSILAETVRRYERPGMCYRFFAQACIDRLGWRGYRPMIGDNGDPVKAGTLFLGEISREKAEARRLRWARESEDQVRELSEAYIDATEQELLRSAASGSRISGMAALAKGERVNVNASDVEGYLGESRETGLVIERA